MPILAMLLAAQPIAGAAPLPPCRAGQLALSLDGKDGDFNGMSHAGTELSIRNRGADCLLPALPTIRFRDARGRVLPTSRRAPVGMHPGPVMLPVPLAAGHRAVSDIRWVSGPVFRESRSVHAARVSVRIGSAAISSPTTALIYGEAGRAVTFEQTPLRAVEDITANEARK